MNAFHIDQSIERKLLNLNIIQQSIFHWRNKYGNKLCLSYLQIHFVHKFLFYFPVYDAFHYRIELPYDVKQHKSRYRALSIRQPFVEAILRGTKIVENCSRKVIPLSGSNLK